MPPLCFARVAVNGRTSSWPVRGNNKQRERKPNHESVADLVDYGSRKARRRRRVRGFFRCRSREFIRALEKPISSCGFASEGCRLKTGVFFQWIFSPVALVDTGLFVNMAYWCSCYGQTWTNCCWPVDAVYRICFIDMDNAIELASGLI